MIHDGDVLYVEAKTEAGPAESGVATVFEAHPLLLSDSNPPSIVKVSETFLVCNTSEATIEVGDRLPVARTMQGHFIVVSGQATASKGATILVALEMEYAGESGDEDCGSRGGVSGPLLARVLRRPCGVARVQGEDDDGYVEVIDEMGWLENQSASRVNNKKAFAHLLSAGDSGGECQWVLDIPNLFQERQFVQDWYVSGLDIIEEKVNAHVWNWCRLDDEVTPGVDCAEEEYGV